MHRLRTAVVMLTMSLPGLVWAGVFVGAESLDTSIVVHPKGYTGSGGTLNLTVCIDPSSPNAASMAAPVQNAIATWNGLAPTSPNLSLGASNNIPSSDVDFESVVLHEMGHCLGLGHPNLATESGLTGDDQNYTKSTKGPDASYDLDKGADNLRGSSDDLRDDDENVHWFRISNNNPFTIAGTVDSTTYTRSLASLPVGHTYAANADRDVGAALGFADAEAVMQQGQFVDEAQRALNHDDVATLKLAESGLDMIAGNSDDYTVALSYGGMTTGCDLNLKFDDAEASFAQCNVSLGLISGSHWSVASADLYFNTGFSWFFNTLGTTTTSTSMPVVTTTSTTLPPSTVTTGITGLKLILVDKYALAGKAKVVFVSKDTTPGAIHKGMEASPPAMSGTVEIYDKNDPSNVGIYDLAPANWVVNKSSVAKYVFKPAGASTDGAKVLVAKPDLLLKVVGKNLGDGDAATGSQGASDLELSGLAVNDELRVRVTIVNATDGSTHIMCSDFTLDSVAAIAAGTGWKVVSRTSTAPGSCS
jgi:hypothetical protein